jgi:hypothetical protein
LEFEATNNVAEYEASILGLEVARKMHITKLVAFVDSELIVHQIRGGYQTRHLIMRACKNQVWDLIDNFYKDFNITALSREFNQRDDSLAVASNNLKYHNNIQMRYEIEMRYRTSIHDNVKYWKVFEDDQHIKIFLEVIHEFSNTYVDLDVEEKGKIVVDTEMQMTYEFSEYKAGHKLLQLRIILSLK